MQKKTNNKSTTTDNNHADAEDLDNVDKIRDILFGNQMRDFDRKFSQLEERIADDLGNLRKENALQIESLQTYIESEIEILASKLSGEEKNRIDEMDNLDADLKKNVKQIDKKIADVGKSLDSQSRETNQKMLKQSQDFNTEMNNQFDQVRKRMDEYKQELTTSKVDKSILAEMLNSLALQINADE